MLRKAEARVKRADIVFPFHEFPGREDEGQISIILPHQREFLENKATICMALWGIGSGKSITVAVKHLHRAMCRPGKVSAYIAQTGPTLTRVVVEKIEELNRTFQELHGFPLVRAWHKSESVYTLINNHRVRLIPSDNSDKLQGPEYTHVSIEEAGIIYHQEKVLTEIVERGRTNADFQCNIATSFKPGSWIIAHVRERFQAGDPTYWMSKYASTANPLVQEKTLETLRGMTSEIKYRQDILSDDEADFGGTVYGAAFHRTESLAPRGWDVTNLPRSELNTRYVLVCGIDWGTGQGHLVTVLKDRKEKLDYIVDDLPINRGGYEESVRACGSRIVEYFKTWGLLVPFAYTDPTGYTWNRMLRDYLRQHDLATQIQYAWDSLDRNIQEGTELVRARFKTADGRRHLLIRRAILDNEWNKANGRGIYPSLQKYRFRETTDGENTGKPFDDEKHTHSCDALRYIYAFEKTQDAPPLTRRR